MSKRDLKLDQYGISRNRYRELSNFCLQYREFIEEKNDCYGLNGSAASGMPHGSGVSDHTARKAERAYIYSEKVDMIEDSSKESSGLLYPWILRAVTDDLTYGELNPPFPVNVFNYCRIQFFCILDKKSLDKDAVKW